MSQLSPEFTQRILSNPSFKELASARAKLRWTLSLITLALFFGFIAVISTARGALGANVANSSIPLGLMVAFTMIVLVVLLTGFYVQRSNARFDRLAQILTREFGQ